MVNFIRDIENEIDYILDDYKVYFANKWTKEKFKWIAIKHFQDNWNIESPNFAEMFENATAKTNNLLAARNYYPRGVIIECAKSENEKVREMFKNLFDESIDLIERIKKFEINSNNIFQSIKKDNSKKHYQTLNAISTYLWLKYPNKYTIYKPTFLDNLIVQLCESDNTKKDRYEKMLLSFEIYNKISECTKNRSDIKEMFYKACTNDCYSDPEFKTLSIDIVYFINNVYYFNNEWYPTDSEYNPQISKNQWIKLLQNTNLMNEAWYKFFAAFYQYPEGVSCGDIAEECGKTVASINGTCVAIGKAIHKETNCPLWKPEAFEKYYPIMFLCRDTCYDEQGSFVWKLRDELYEALTEFDIEQYGLMKVESVMSNTFFPKNIILYGPPGTGKTYNTVNYAVAIIENKDIVSVSDENHENVLERYRKYKSEGLIEFTTFHQSFGYEEFLEGIRPDLEDSEGGDIKYKIVDGIFKRFCKSPDSVSSSSIMVTFEDAWNNLVKDAAENNNSYKFTKATGNQFVLELINENKFRRNFGENNNHNDISKSDVLKQYRNEYNYEQMGSGTKELYRMREAILLELKNRYSLDNPANNTDSVVKNKVFIIDEINRGNISKILGELITLIEPSKRLGKPEEMKSTLVYSGEEFGVPDNVYIIGTMNTADRSISLMDTALRRRFQFIEMMPDSKVLNSIGIGTIKVDNETLNVSRMLDIINKRIEYLYDREHMIGHAFFTPLKDDSSLTMLSEIFKNKVIPLLQEYFYEDYSKIQLVLGDNYKSQDKYKFIYDISREGSIFNGNPDIDVEEISYEIQEEAFSIIRSYKEIGKGL